IRRHGQNKTTAALFLGVAILGAVAFGVYISGGVPERPFTVYTHQAESYVTSIARTPLHKQCYGLVDTKDPDKKWKCTLGDIDASEWIMAYGDSHSLSMIPAFDRYGKIAAVRVVYAGESACLPLLGVYVDRFNGKDCAPLAKRTVALAATQHPAAIVLVARWTVYVGGKTRPNERKQIYRIDDEGNIDK